VNVPGHQMLIRWDRWCKLHWVAWDSDDKRHCSPKGYSWSTEEPEGGERLTAAAAEEE
ncbi:hypothetical protein AMECASPLE_027114, partial [Ameca splendens]